MFCFPFLLVAWWPRGRFWGGGLHARKTPTRFTTGNNEARSITYLLQKFSNTLGLQDVCLRPHKKLIERILKHLLE